MPTYCVSTDDKPRFQVNVNWGFTEQLSREDCGSLAG